MIVAVDAMGGDNAPATIVEGAVMAARDCGIQILLVGLEDKIKEELNRYSLDGLSIQIKHASEIVEMGESPSRALRQKQDSSIRVAVESVRSGEAAAMVSAGNTGAVLAVSTIVLRPLPEIDRAAIAVLLPTAKGPVVFLDAGANVDCKSELLFQFAIMGHVYARYQLKKLNPVVGLLSIGEEDSKGNEITKEAFQMLKQSHLNFVGNVEAKEVYRGNAEVIVCDGFTGNIALKISESLAEMIEKSLRDLFASNLRTKFAYLLMKPFFRIFKKTIDYSEYGGAPLLGINGICIISHGSSSPKAIKNAIKQADEFIKNKVNQHIQEDLKFNLKALAKPAKKGKFWKQLKDSISFPADKET
mgnify:FL=1|jgi:glycerol-3-phosphate acyltransferase PlsX|tara:strand:+ start:859 stop:1935 length:1077 start_codon:yes stop_codon:yes gene_type:complete